jgi:Leucine-rich repeat (LRR) protein
MWISFQFLLLISKAFAFSVESICPNHLLDNCEASNFTILQNEFLITSRQYKFTKRLLLHRCDMKKIHENLFSTFPNLNEIRIWDCNLESLDVDSLKSAKLKKFYIGNNNFRILKKETFRMCKSLQVLQISNNNLEEIEPTTFRNLDTLKSIDLSLNKLKSLEGMFQNMSSLISIDVDGNKISVIRKGDFKDCINVEHIHLYNNQIVEIERGSFDYFLNLTSLDLSKNKLMNLDTIHVSEVNFAKNYLKSYMISNITTIVTIDHNFLENIECTVDNLVYKLSATHNSLDDWTCIRKMHNLRVLYLSHNKFQEVNCKILSPIRNIRILTLDHNRFQNLKLDDFYTLNELFTLSVDNFTDYDNIHGVLPKLKSLELAMYNWECSNIAKVFCHLKRNPRKQ